MSSTTPPPPVVGCRLSYPAPWVILVTVDREQRMNSIPHALHWQMHELLLWFDREESLRVLIITGAGKKAFCAGQDLFDLRKQATALGGPTSIMYQPPTGFAGISRRTGKKPVVAAVNGYALGGGFEMTLNWLVNLECSRL